MDRITKPKREERIKPKMPEPIDSRIDEIIKEKTPMSDAFGAAWYRARDLDTLLRGRFNAQGKDFISTLVAVLKTNRHPMARSSAAKILGEVGADHSIYLEAEEPLLHSSKHDSSPDVRQKADDAAFKVNQKKLMDIILGKHVPDKKKAD